MKLSEKISGLKNNNPAVRDISFSKLTEEEIFEVITALKNNTHLRSFSLKDCYHNISKHAYYFGQILKNAPLEKMSVHGALLGFHLKDFLEGLQFNQTITKLDLSYNDLDSTQIHHMADIIKKNGKIKCLDLRLNKINGAAARDIAEALKINNNLRHIDLCMPLNHITMGDEGAIALATALGSNTTLQKIDLRYQKIGNEGAKAWGELLKNSSYLTHLFLGHNTINSEGIRALGEGLSFNTRLEQLELDGNIFALEDIRFFAKYLKNNRSIILFDTNFIKNIQSSETEKVQLNAIKTKIENYLCRNQLHKIQIAAQENDCKSLAHLLKLFYKNKLNPQSLFELVPAVFSLEPKNSEEKKIIYRLTLWLLQNSLQNPNFKVIIDICAQKLNDKLLPQENFSSQIIYLSYLQLLKTDYIVRTQLQCTKEEIAENKELISLSERLILQSNIPFDLHKTQVFLTNPAIRKELNLQDDSKVEIIDSLCLNNLETPQVSIQQDLKNLAKMQLQPAYSTKDLIKNRGFFGCLKYDDQRAPAPTSSPDCVI